MRDPLIVDFLKRAGWAHAERRPLAGDASTRRYERLQRDAGSAGHARAILMDAPRAPDGPPIRDGKPYSAIARLAEDCRAFVAIGERLRAAGLSAPELIAHDMENGLLLLEDLGDHVYGTSIEKGEGPAGEPLDELYRMSVEALLSLHEQGPPTRLALPDGTAYDVPPYDETALAIESELLVDWYLPAKRGKPSDGALSDEYRGIWASLFPEAAKDQRVLTLRDYHSPNLIWLGEREAHARVGIIDYQDAVVGAQAYDMVSLLQDARRDVPPEREAAMLDYYIAEANRRLPGFDERAFLAAYAILGAHRNAKILGIFVRLKQRDGKPHYLAHVPRVATYFERDLNHPALGDLKSWLDPLVPAGNRLTVDGL